MKKSPNKTKRMDRLVLYIIIAVLVTVIGFCSWWFLMGGMYVSEQGKMETYLRDKYDEEFIVNNLRIEGSGLGVKGDLYGDARPQNNSRLKFQIWDITGRKDSSRKYLDEYPGVTWTEEATSTIKPLLVQIFGYEPKYELKIHTAQMNSKIRGKLIDFESATEKYQDSISISLTVYTSEKVNTSNKSTHLNRLEKLIRYLKSTGARATLTYSDPDKSGGCYMEYQALINIRDIKSIESCLKESR